MMQDNLGRGREVFFDALKIIAIFLVIYNHTVGFHHFLGASEAGLTQFLYIAFSVFCKLAVPLFFMISGALLLGRGESLHRIICHRVARFAVILVVFSLLTVGVLAFKGDKFSFYMIIKGLLNNGLPITGTYHFLYSYIGMLLMLPFFRKIAVSLKKNELVLLVVIYVFLSSVIPCVRLLCKYLSVEELKLAYNFLAVVGPVGERPIFYPLLGYWLHKNIDVLSFTKRHLGFFALSIVATMCAMSLMSMAQYNIEGKYTQDFLGCFVLFTTVPVFFLMKYIFYREYGICGSAKFQSLVVALGPLTFFVYLADELLRYLVFYRYSVYIQGLPMFQGCPFLYSVLWCMLSMAFLAAVAALLRKNSLLKSYI